MSTIQFLAEWALRSSILIVSGALLLQALRVKDPSIRSAAWTAMLCASLAIPALTAALPKLPLIVMRAAPARTEAPKAVNESAPEPEPAAPLPDVRADRPSIGIPENASSSHPPRFLGSDGPHRGPEIGLAQGGEGGKTNSPLAPLGERGRGVRGSVPSPIVKYYAGHHTSASKPFDWARAAVTLYVLVVLALLLRLTFGLAMSLRLLRRSRVTEGVTEGIEIRESDRVASPVTLGIARSTIVLPGDWREWDQAKLQAVLAHERSHIRRRDPAVQLLSGIHRALLWHSPLSWFLHRRIVRVAEEASDDAALAVTRDRALYAELLLEFIQRGGRGASWQGVPMSRYGRADKRIHRILEGTALSQGITRWSAAAIVALGLPLACVVAAAYPVAAPPTQAITVPAAPVQTADQVTRNEPAPSRPWTPFEANMVDRDYHAGSQAPVSVERYLYARRDDGSSVNFWPILPNGKRVNQRVVEDYSTRTRTSMDPSTKTLIRYPYSTEAVDYLSTPPRACSDSQAAHVEILGYDTVEVKFTVGEPHEGFPVTEWRAPRLNCFALKSEWVFGSSTDIREAQDVKEGAPAASLFEIPSTYTELPAKGLYELKREKAQATTNPADLCTIQGVVVNAGSGEPVSGITVAASPDASNREPSDAELTDSNGRFELKGLAPGRYELWAQRDEAGIQIYGQSTPGGPGTVLTLSPGQKLSGITFKIIPSAADQQKFDDAIRKQNSEDLAGALPGFEAQAVKPGPKQAESMDRVAMLADLIADANKLDGATTGKAGFNIVTDPPGAKVLIDGNPYGPSPVHVELAPGTHTYVVKQPGALPYQSTVTLRNGEIVNKTLRNLGGAQGTGMVEVRTTPPGATVLVDGSPVGGRTPTAFRLLKGTHTLVITSPGHRPIQQEVTISENQTTTVNERMPAGMGEVRGVTPDVTVISAGRNAVVTLLPSGDYQPWTRTVHKGQMVPDYSVDGGLKPVSLAVPPVAGAPAGASFVLLMIIIDENGRVASTRVLSDDHGLSPQVVAAAKGWRFSPPTVKGTPVSTSIAVKVTVTARATPQPAPSIAPVTQPTPKSPAPAAAEVDPRVVRGKIAMGDFHLHRGEFDDAIASFQEGLSLDPSNAALRQNLASAIEACKEEKAIVDEGLRCGAPGPAGRMPSDAQQRAPQVTDAVFHILTRPPGAEVSIDGKSYGLTPVRVILPPGDYTYTVILPGVAALEKAITLRGGEIITKTFSFAGAAHAGAPKTNPQSAPPAPLKDSSFSDAKIDERQTRAQAAIPEDSSVPSDFRPNSPVKASGKEMETPYTKWLSEEVPYIITEQERAAFKKLSTDEEREAFIANFWERRNPNPGSPQNEFREEHYRRIAYANQHYATRIPGWKTDRGRIYIMYGSPDVIESHPTGGPYKHPDSEGGGETFTFPFEQWRYRYIAGIGKNIVLEFVDAGRDGEYHLTMDHGEKDALLHGDYAPLVTPGVVGGQDRISSIIIRGNDRIPASTIRKSISTNPGDIYEPAKIERDVTALKKTGYFDAVRVEASDDPTGTKGGTVVIFYVREKKDAGVQQWPPAHATQPASGAAAKSASTPGVTSEARKAPLSDAVVYILGAVQKPRDYPLAQGMKLTIAQALAQAGDLLQTAKRRVRITVLRETANGTRTEIPADLNKVMEGQKVDVELSAGDILFVSDGNRRSRNLQYDPPANPYPPPPPVVGQNSGPEKGQTANVRPLFTFGTGGPSGVRGEQWGSEMGTDRSLLKGAARLASPRQQIHSPGERQTSATAAELNLFSTPNFAKSSPTPPLPTLNLSDPFKLQSVQRVPAGIPKPATVLPPRIPLPPSVCSVPLVRVEPDPSMKYVNMDSAMAVKPPAPSCDERASVQKPGFTLVQFLNRR